MTPHLPRLPAHPPTPRELGELAQLLFEWPIRRSPRLTLPLCILAATLVQAGVIVLFSIQYGKPKEKTPPQPRFYFLPGRFARRTKNRALARSARSFCLFSPACHGAGIARSTAAPVPAQLRGSAATPPPAAKPGGWRRRAARSSLGGGRPPPRRGHEGTGANQHFSSFPCGRGGTLARRSFRHPLRGRRRKVTSKLSRRRCGAATIGLSGGRGSRGYSPLLRPHRPERQPRGRRGGQGLDSLPALHPVDRHSWGRVRDPVELRPSTTRRLPRAMIPVSFPWFVAVYLALFLAGVLALWFGYEIMRKRQAARAQRSRVFCRICGSRYTDTSAEELIDCPVCGSRNERGS